MCQKTLKLRSRTISFIGIVAVIFTIYVQAHAAETRRCHINGKTVITNLTCQQLANEAGIPQSGSEKPQLVIQPKLTQAPPPNKITKAQPVTANNNVVAASAAIERGVDKLVSTILTLGAAMLFIIGLVIWLKHGGRQVEQIQRGALVPLARDKLEPVVDKQRSSEDEELPYRQAPVMSRYELEMFERIKTAFPECEIFPQVPLASFIRIDKQRAGARLATNSYRWQNRIGQQRVDFLACLRLDMSTVAAIELDDPSHESVEAQRRDAKKNKSLSDANVPLLRWRVEAMPNTEEIRQEFLQRGLIAVS